YMPNGVALPSIQQAEPFSTKRTVRLLGSLLGRGKTARQDASRSTQFLTEIAERLLLAKLPMTGRSWFLGRPVTRPFLLCLQGDRQTTSNLTDLLGQNVPLDVNQPYCLLCQKYPGLKVRRPSPYVPGGCAPDSSVVSLTIPSLRTNSLFTPLVVQMPG